MLHPETKERISTIVLSENSSVSDGKGWEDTPKGEFSVKTAYEHITCFRAFIC